jgi:hypothetical protein
MEPSLKTARKFGIHKKLNFKKIKKTLSRRYTKEIISNGLANSEIEAEKLVEKFWPDAKKTLILQTKAYSRPLTFKKVKAYYLSVLKQQLEVDSLDAGLLAYLNKINLNPELVATYSCSGLPDKKKKPFHGGEGHPIIGIRFGSVLAMKMYVRELRHLGYSVKIIDDLRHLDKFSLDLAKALGDAIKAEKIYPKIIVYIANTNSKENFVSGKAKSKERMATPKQSKKFWKDVTKILSNKKIATMSK